MRALADIRRGSETVRGEGIDHVETTIRYTLQAQGNVHSDTLACVGVEPWIVAGPHFVLIASPLLPEGTTFPVSVASFVPWVASVISDRLGGDVGRVLAATPGQRIPGPAWADAMEGHGTAPSAGEDMVAPRDAGTYFFLHGGHRVGAMVVNSEPEESVLERWSAAPLALFARDAMRRVLQDQRALRTMRGSTCICAPLPRWAATAGPPHRVGDRNSAGSA